MSTVLIVGVALSAALLLAALALTFLSRIGPSNSPRGRVGSGQGDDGVAGAATLGGLASAGGAHHAHPDTGFHTGGTIGHDGGGYHTGGFDGGSDGGGGDGGGGGSD